MNAATLRAIVEGITEGLNGAMVAFSLRLEALAARLDKVPAGPPGVGIKAIAQAPDLASADIELDNGQVIELQLPAGPPGKDGTPPTAAEVAAQLAALPEFLSKATPPATPAGDVAAALARLPDFVASCGPDSFHAAPWVPAIYRAGAEVTHYIGRHYVAEQDTNEEPGDSPAWLRVGTVGLRHIGGAKDEKLMEAGDIYAKSGACFLFDGATHRMLFARPYTASDAEKDRRELVKGLGDLAAKVVKMAGQLQDADTALGVALAELEQLREQQPRAAA
jgi:hypothetical protein